MKFYLFFYFLILCSFLKGASTPLLDIEEQSQDFVLELKQIVLPDYKEAFNPSIVRWNGRLLMSFRILLEPERPWGSLSALGLVWLNDDLNPISTPQLIQDDKISLDDCRLISVQDKLFVIFSQWVPEVWSQKMYSAEIIYDNVHFSIQNIKRLFTDTEKTRIEKNWVPFEYEEKLLLSYSLDPHLVFLPNLETGTCTMASFKQSYLNWPWGELRGGTQAFPEGSCYLGFFHSCQDMASKQSCGSNACHYFIGAYQFSNTPPFELSYISPKPIIAKGFYSGPTYTPYWDKEVRVVFPGGFISDDNFIWILYGRQDHECCAIKLDKKKLFESLVPVNCCHALINWGH